MSHVAELATEICGVALGSPFSIGTFAANNGQSHGEKVINPLTKVQKNVRGVKALPSLSLLRKYWVLWESQITGNTVKVGSLGKSGLTWQKLWRNPG